MAQKANAPDAQQSPGKQEQKILANRKGESSNPAPEVLIAVGS